MNANCFYTALNNMFKKLLVALPLFSLLTAKTFSQKLNEDSIKKIIKETNQDTTRVLALRRLANYYILHTGQDSAGLVLLNQADEQARKINFHQGICEVLLTQGNYYFRKNDWVNAIARFKELIVQSQLVNDSLYSKRTKMMAMNDLAGIHSQNGDYTTALDYYLKSRDILETIKPDATSLCIVYVNIAGIYNILDQPKQAEEYLAKCYPLLDAAKPDLRYLYWQERQNLADKNKDAKMVLLTIDSLERSLKTSSLSEYEQNQYDQTLYEMRGDYQSNYLKNYTAANGS